MRVAVVVEVDSAISHSTAPNNSETVVRLLAHHQQANGSLGARQVKVFALLVAENVAEIWPAYGMLSLSRRAVARHGVESEIVSLCR